MATDTIIEAKDLCLHFKIDEDYTVKAIDGVSLEIKDGEVFGLVGETGCGKSTTARALCGMYKPTGGDILYRGESVKRKETLNRMHKEIQMIFQDSGAALNPRMTVEKIILEPLKIHHMPVNSADIKHRFDYILEKSGLDKSHLSKYPQELSGGQRQRVAIARSLIMEPRLVVADEPVASLDISIPAQIINLFKHLQNEHGFTILFIAHDLSVVRFISDRVGVMLKGRLVELGPTEELFNNPVHPYTKSLLSAIHIPDPEYERNKVFLEYDTEKPLGDTMLEVSPGHFVLEEI